MCTPSRTRRRMKWDSLVILTALGHFFPRDALVEMSHRNIWWLEFLSVDYRIAIQFVLWRFEFKLCLLINMRMPTIYIHSNRSFIFRSFDTDISNIFVLIRDWWYCWLAVCLISKPWLEDFDICLDYCWWSMFKCNRVVHAICLFMQLGLKCHPFWSFDCSLRILEYQPSAGKFRLQSPYPWIPTFCRDFVTLVI